MKFGKIIKNDFTAGDGVCVTIYVSGCELHCPGCQNPEAQSFDYGEHYNVATTFDIIQALRANGIKRNLCIMGGEPLAFQNQCAIMQLIMDVRTEFPDIKIYVWTGYTYEWLMNEIEHGEWPEPELEYILSHIDYLIDGPYIEAQRDTTLKMRGSKNQRILHLTKGKIFDIIE